MNIRKALFELRASISGHFRVHKQYLIWLMLFACGGIVIGVITLFSPTLKVTHIHTSLLDVNIVNITRSASVGSLLATRALSFALTSLFLFLLCLNRFSAFICFPYLSFRGFALVMNLYYLVAKFGMLSGFLLAIFYLFILITLLIIEIYLILYLIKQGAELRMRRRAFIWSYLFHGILTFMTIILCLAFVELVFYFLLFNKMVFLV